MTHHIHIGIVFALAVFLSWLPLAMAWRAIAYRLTRKYPSSPWGPAMAFAV